ncbi:hypothetical protein BDK51DRAFT_18365, partial [Blyttiomyces helicus]
LQVVKSGTDGEFKSKLVTLTPVAKGGVVAKIEGQTKAAKRWSSVQVSADEHIELNSDLIFMNHSCNPSVFIDVKQMEIIATRDLNSGDEITFFYPSTEWEMSQPFECWCGGEKCLKKVSGAKDLPADVLSHFQLSPHIEALLASRQ